GSHDVDIEHITLSLVTRMEVEGGEEEGAAAGEFHRVTGSSPIRLAEGRHSKTPRKNPRIRTMLVVTACAVTPSPPAQQTTARVSHSCGPSGRVSRLGVVT
ncbi:MAG TPA: sporulation protein, partial [Actinoplanes sp.]|nr:sporulation protein [Actinoplanes sp.]